MSDPLALLARADKSILGSGDGCAFAPAPDYDVPGFWAGAVVLGRAVAPLFAVTVLDQEGRELVPFLAAQRWSPAELIADYRFTHGVQGTEVRTVHPGGVFVSEWRLSSMTPMSVHVIAWTVIESAALHANSVGFNGALAFRRDSGNSSMSCELAAVGGATSWGAYASEGAFAGPLWRATPFLEHWTPTGLPRHVVSAVAENGRWFGAVHRNLRIDREGAVVTFAMRAIPHDAALRPPAASQGAAPSSGTFESASRRRWASRFGSVPPLEASDPYISRVYCYRWFGAWLLRIDPHTGAFLSGGTSAHSASIGVSEASLVPALVRDLRWHPDPQWARAALFQFLDHQREDGSLPRTVSVTGPSTTNAPPAIDWGGALRAFAELEDDPAHIESAWRSLERYANWLFAKHDKRDSGLIDVWHPEDSEYASTPRFTARRLKGVDAAAMAYSLCAALGHLAGRVGASADAWTTRADKVRRAVLARMWDDELGMFCDIDSATGERVRVRSAAGFAPFAVGLASADTVAKLTESLLDVRRFWTPFPVPSLAADEPAFDAFGEWKDVRVERPKNGRTWPGETALIVDALVAAEPEGDGPLRRAAGQLLRRLIRMHFHDGDVLASSAPEHVNPYTGHASAYRGVDEYFAAWLVDLIVRHAAGIRPTVGGVRIDPLALGLGSLSLKNVRIRSQIIDVRIDTDSVNASVNGVQYNTTIGTPVEVAEQ